MWILAIIGMGVVTALIHLGVLGWDIGTAGICEVIVLHQFAVTSGLIGVIGFYINVIKADETAKSLGWPGGPFQVKYGFSQLGVGVMGVLSIFFRGSFWFGTLVTLYIYGISGLWSHIAEMKRKKVNPIDTWNIILDIIYHIVLTILLLQIPSVWN
ncbi:MAG TPA: hypothetical protein DCG49_05975 [Ruminococcus sp.]|nr:hypothetical protein [Ruminococcus sp.]